MDTARARALLDQERRRLEQLGRAVARDHDDAVAGSSPEDQLDGADRRVTEETSQALSERLRDRWGALERAEARLAAGTFGVSILSGRPIPDERLEAFPLAELTVDEEATREQTERPFAEGVERAADGEDRAGRDPALLDAARLGPSREPFQVLQDPAVQDNPLVEDDDTTFDEPPPEHDPALPDAVTEDDTGRIQPLP